MSCTRIEIRVFQRLNFAYAKTSEVSTMEISRKLNTLIMMLPQFVYGLSLG